MIVLDTTVLVYAKGAEHGLREPSRRLLAAVADGGVEATTTIEVIQELAHVRARRRGPADAAALARGYADLLAPLLLLNSDHLRRGLDLFERLDGLGAFDAVLATATLEVGATHLVSADRGFAQVEGLAHVFPDSAGVATVLS